MHASAAVLPVLVAVVLLVGGVAKIRHRADTRGALGLFGFPPPLIPVTAAVLPWAEILVALILLAGGGPVFVLGAAGAVGLTGGFFVVVARALMRGEDFECGCFGSWNRTRISPLLAVRNGVLLAAAIATAVLAAAGFPGVPETLTHATGADAHWAAMLLVGMALAALFTASARIAGAEPVPAVSNPGGRDAADVEVVTAAGEVTRLRDLAQQRPQLVMFVRPGCGSCEDLLRDLEDGRLAAEDALIAVSGNRAVFETAHPALASRALYAVQAARDALGVHKTPAAVVVGLNGAVDAGPAAGAPAVRALLSKSAQTA